MQFRLNWRELAHFQSEGQSSQANPKAITLNEVVENELITRKNSYVWNIYYEIIKMEKHWSNKAFNSTEKRGLHFTDAAGHRAHNISNGKILQYIEQ